MSPLPHQVIGADFLAERRFALLADAPRVGKTGTAILAADEIAAARVLVVTTASGRPVWARAWADWSAYDRNVQAYYGGALTAAHKRAGVLIIGWSHAQKLLAEDPDPYDLVIADESHYAKSVEAKRTHALYGEIKRNGDRGPGLVDKAETVWCLTGTPIPNAPNDLYPMLRGCAPHRIKDVLRYDDFLSRYCIVKPKRISRYTKIDVVIGGRNMDELRQRMDGVWLRRTQQDVGITAPIYDLLPVHLTAAQRRQIEAEVDGADEILAAAETGDTRTLEMQLGTLRRVTGTIKAEGVALAVSEELQSGTDKIVVMCWHRDVMDHLQGALQKYGVVRVDGATSPKQRDEAQRSFADAAGARVFVGQIIAAGEAIDLSAAAELIFAESSFVPKDMAQAALRITNHTQTRRPRVRVAALEGSIDEALQAILTRKVQTINEVMK